MWSWWATFAMPCDVVHVRELVVDVVDHHAGRRLPGLRTHRLDLSAVASGVIWFCGLSGISRRNPPAGSTARNSV